MITTANYKTFARKHYQGTDIRTSAEFKEDLNRVNHIIRSLNRMEDKSFNPRVLINQVITFFNVFDVTGGVALVEFKIGNNPLLKARFAACCYALSRATADQHTYSDLKALKMIEEELKRGVN